MYTHKCIYIYIYTYVYMYNHIHMHLLHEYIHMSFCMHEYIYIYVPHTISYIYIYIPPFNPGIFREGRTRNFSGPHENTPPHVFWASKEVGGVLRMPHFSPEMVWHTLSFSTYVHTYIHTCMHSTRPWRDHNYHIFLAEILLGVGGDTPTLFETFQFLPPQPSLPWTE